MAVQPVSSMHHHPQAYLFILTTSFVNHIMKLYDFLVEHAKFPFPDPGKIQSAGSTDISTTKVGLVKVDWKAQHAVRDNTLVQKLCRALKKILGNAPLAAGAENYLLPSFSPQIDEHGSRDLDWISNPSETHVSFSNNSGSSCDAG